MDKILEVNNLHVSFNTYAGEVKAVRGVSFHLEKKETLAFVGESGCGKSVTAKSILRLLNPSVAEIKKGSEIKYSGKDVLAMNKKELNSFRGQEISMIFQDPMTSLNPTMTVGKQIMESLKIHRNLNEADAKKEAIRILELVKIPDAKKRVDSYPHELSGGMRQRVMIAIALSCEPNVLIADEPTTALDVTIQAQILHLIHELKDNLGTAVILVTHDLGVVANYADRIQVMYAGQIMERGSTPEIFQNAKHPYTWALLKSIPKLAKNTKEELYTLLGTPPDLVLPLKGCPFAARCEYCMKICKEETPAEVSLSDTHKVSCWLMHPGAPKVKGFYEDEVLR